MTTPVFIPQSSHRLLDLSRTMNFMTPGTSELLIWISCEKPPTQVKCLQKNTGNKPPLTSSQTQWALFKKWRKTVIFWQKNKRKVLTLVGHGAIKF